MEIEKVYGSTELPDCPNAKNASFYARKATKSGALMNDRPCVLSECPVYVRAEKDGDVYRLQGWCYLQEREDK